ncbi:MAG: perosamine synthetase [Thermosipho sp. (in: thermotogales)]|jgi:perosamine synthetase|nr:perosamine synthetase [Thermosipho sp. (in: thermotogales)]
MEKKKKMIPVYEPDLTELEKKMLIKAFDSGWISSKGKYIDLFEEEFSKFLGVKHSITVSNGTVSLHLILKALDIGNGHEVIVPTFTYIASVNAIKYVNAVPVFVDCEEGSWNMNVREVEKKITSKTKAIMAVHLYGQSVDLDPLREICNKYNIYLIEDAAEAFGTKYKGKMVGSFGIAGSFSFYGNKTITTGEGGMVVTNDEKLASKIRKLKNQGNSEKFRYWHDIIGYNYRLTNLQAAIGYAQLLRANKILDKKRKIAEWYKKYLNHNLIYHPPVKEYSEDSFWMYSILLDKKLENYRDIIMKTLEKEYKIETRPFFYPVTEMPMYKIYKTEEFINAEKIHKRGINLPSSSTLKEEDIKYISEAIVKVINKIMSNL